MGQIHGVFAILLGISQILYLAVVLTLGVRLLLLALRTQKLPEALLAIHFTLCAGLGYLLLVVALSAARDPGLLPPALVTAMIGLGQLGSCVGVFGSICFNFLVFRRSEPWARGLVWLAAVAMSIGYVGYGLTGSFSHGRFEGVWFWLFYGTFAWGGAWVMVEPLRYYRVMRKRLQLGLAEPLVVNRFLLWGIGSVCRFVMVIGAFVPALLSPDKPTDLVPGVVTISVIVISLVGLGLSVTYWLTFFPTRRYVRFVTQRYSPARS